MANYKRNYLEKVIVRIDFEELSLTKITKFIDLIKPNFSKVERQVRFEGEITISNVNEAPTQVSKQIAAWVAKNDSNTKRIDITPKSIFIEYDKYKNSNELIEDVEKCIDPFCELFGLKIAKRIGVRFINVIKPKPEGNALDWKDYINDKLLGSLNFANTSGVNLSRTMGQVIHHDSDFDLKFDFGIWNNDYPNKVTRKEFILDYDCYTTLPIGVDEIKLSTMVKNFNDQIDKLFEASIKTKLRELMNK